MSKLNAARRNALPDRDFAIVKTVNGKKVREYPIEDKGHAKAALSEVTQHGSPQEKRIVDHKVAMRYHDMQVRAAKASQ